MKLSTTEKCATEFLVMGIGLFLLCLIMLFGFPGLYKSQMYKQMVLVQGTAAYPLWQDIPTPIYERLYFFNITNAEEFLKHGAKLKVKQVGPYTYESKWVKDPVAWHPNGTVSYREIRTYHFLPQQSSGSEDDKIITFNGPMITAANLLKNLFLPLKMGASFFLGLENEKVIIERTIRELAFGGYKDPLIKYSALIVPDMPYKDGMFSWLYGKNGTDDGMFTVFTGQKDIQSLNVISRWNGGEKLLFWKGDTCNMINGSSGEMGPPLKDDQQNYTFFQSIFCRSLTFSYTGEQNVRGVKAKRFAATERVFANASDNPDNVCFQTTKYMPSGVQDLSGCQYGSPVFISFPHFYLADPVYLQMIDGLNPQEESHTAYIDVEPTTGFAVDFKARYQLNLRLGKILGLLQFQHIPEGIFPVFWAEIDGSLTDDLAKFLLNHLGRPKIIFYSLVGIVTAISVIMITGAVIVLVLVRLPRMIKIDQDDDPLLDTEYLKAKVRNAKLCQEKQKHDDVKNYGACFGDSPDLQRNNPNCKEITGPGTFENDPNLLDASGVPDQP